MSYLCTCKTCTPLQFLLIQYTNETTYSNTEAKTYDYNDINFGKKWYIRLCVHSPMNICTPLQILLLQYTTQKTKTTLEATTFDYNDVNFEETVVHTDFLATPIAAVHKPNKHKYAK